MRGRIQAEVPFGASIFEHDPEDTVTTLVGKAIVALQKAVSGKRDVVYFIELTKG